MGKLLSGLAVALAVAWAAGGAVAEPLAYGVTARDIVQALETKGYQAQIVADDVGDPKVTSTVVETPLDVYFYGCDGLPRCGSVTFQSAFDVAGESLDKINAWNRDKRWLKCWLDKKAVTVCEMDIDAEEGVTAEQLVHALSLWEGSIAQFKESLGE
jgi:hypothetical protein